MASVQEKVRLLLKGCLVGSLVPCRWRVQGCEFRVAKGDQKHGGVAFWNLQMLEQVTPSCSSPLPLVAKSMTQTASDSSLVCKLTAAVVVRMGHSSMGP